MAHHLEFHALVKRSGVILGVLVQRLVLRVKFLGFTIGCERSFYRASSTFLSRLMVISTH